MLIKTFKKIIALCVITTMLLSAMSFTVMADISVDFKGTETGFASNKNGNLLSGLAEGIGGKSADDKYYSYSTTATNASQYLQPFANNADVEAITYEMSFLLPQGSSGINIKTQHLKVPSSTTSYVASITPEGFAPAGSYNGVIPGTAFDYDKWYNIAITYPYEDVKTFKVYINGRPVLEDNNFKSGNYEIKTLQRNQLSSIAEDGVFYLDNLRQYAGEYTPSYDAAPALTIANANVVGAISGSRIAVKNLPNTVEAVKNAISRAADTNLRFYNAEGTLLTDADAVTEDTSVVAAASNSTGMERTYAYYTIGEAVYEYGDDLLDGTNTWTNKSSSFVYGTRQGLKGKKSDDAVIYSK